MKTNFIPLFVLSAVLLAGCSFTGQDVQTEISSELTFTEEETSSTSEYSHIEIIQETTERSAQDPEETSEEQSQSTAAETSEAETETTAETLPVNENSISAALSAVDGSDIIFFGNIYCDSSLNSCGVLFLTADGRAYGGICGYLGDFRGNSYADYLAALTDAADFGQLSADKSALMTKYAISADPEGEFSETEADTQLEYVSWYECVTYSDSGSPRKILAHADEYGYSYSSHDIYIAEIAKNLSELGIIADWQEYCMERLS